MKNKLAFQIFVIIAVTIIGVLVFKNRKLMAPQSPGPIEKSTDFSNPKPKTAATDEIIVFRAQNTVKQNVVDVELKKCTPFLELSANNNGSSGNSVQSAHQQIKANMQFQSEELEMAEYQLISPAGEQIIVQDNSNEEKKDQVRVFKMAKDGLPDRLKDFPNSNQSKELKLEGALTLGRLIKKIEKFHALSTAGASLFYESEGGVIARVSLTIGKNQLLCEEQKCSCSQF